MTRRAELVRATQRLVLRLAGTRLRPALVIGYAGIARLICAYLIRGEPGAAAYVRGGVGSGDFHPGLSDIDLAIVLADEPLAAGRGAGRVRRRWERLLQGLPWLSPLVDLPRIHEDAELHELAVSSAFTYGLDRAASGIAAYQGPASNLDLIRTLERPGLYAAMDDWSRLRGPDRRPAEPARDRDARVVAGWLDLLWTWRAAFPFIVDPSLPRTAGMCVKLIADPARIWVWLAHGRRTEGRGDALRQALREIPDEEAAIGAALSLNEALPGSPPPPLAELLPAALRLSARVADLIATRIADSGATDVALVGEPGELVTGEVGALALGDWRAVVSPQAPDEAFVVEAGNPGRPAVMAALGHRTSGPYPALAFQNLLLLPAVPFLRTRLRAIKAPVSDPVPFALAAGQPVAKLPEVRGWSVADTARRAVAEHAAWIEHELARTPDRAVESGNGSRIGRLLSATRAALLMESVVEGEPRLCVTATEAVRELAARSPATRATAEEALGRYREHVRSGVEPPASIVAAMGERVRDLPAYR